MDNESKFKYLADEMYDLYLALIDSGFDDHRAFELTKTYCTVAFANNALSKNAKDRQREASWEALRRYRKRKAVMAENKEDTNETNAT